MALGLFLVFGTKVDGLHRRAEERVEEGTGEAGEGNWYVVIGNWRGGKEDGEGGDEGGACEGGEGADEGDAPGGSLLNLLRQVRDQARRMRIQHAEFGGPRVRVDGGEGGGKSQPRPDLAGKESMQEGEESRDASIAEDLTRVAFVAFGVFFVQSLFAFLEGAAQTGGGDEKSEQENRPLPSAHAKDDRSDDGGGNRTADIEAVSAVGEEGDEEGEDESVEKLHLIYDLGFTISDFCCLELWV